MIPDNIDAPIWRYLSLEKLKFLLENNALYFTRADLLGDSHEGSYSEPTIKRRPIFYEGAKEHFIKKGLPDIHKMWRLCTYINCWHVNKGESIAMWKLYSKENKNIAIYSSISLLKKSVLDAQKEFCLGFVNYIDYENDYMTEANAFASFFFKRKIYEHEKEFRILTDELEKFNKVSEGEIEPLKGLLIPIDIKLLINKIVISPFSDVDFEHEVTTLLKKYNLLNKLINSLISREPKF